MMEHTYGQIFSPSLPLLNLCHGWNIKQAMTDLVALSWMELIISYKLTTNMYSFL